MAINKTAERKALTIALKETFGFTLCSIVVTGDFIVIEGYFLSKDYYASYLFERLTGNIFALGYYRETFYAKSRVTEDYEDNGFFNAARYLKGLERELSVAANYRSPF